MKNYFNKGLLYQWFNSAKAFILLGILIWGYNSYILIGYNIERKVGDIANNFNNYYETVHLYDYVVLSVIFVMIHFAGQGISKRNNAMFLNSSPVTKKQIKCNEILCLTICLFIYVLTFIYMAVIRYLNYRNLLSIVDGYFAIIGFEVIRMILIGLIGILFMVIIESMFSNSVIGLFSILSIMPLSVIIICIKIRDILSYIPFHDGKNIFAASNSILSRYMVYLSNLMFERVNIDEMNEEAILIYIVILIIAIVIFFAIYNKMQKINSLEYSTKVFSSKAGEKIVTTLCSIGAGSFVSFFIVSGYIYKLERHNSVGLRVLSGISLVKGLCADIFCIAIVGFIVYKLINKLLKTIE